jgi:hypothetical protein
MNRSCRHPYLHDKDTLETRQRVGFVHLRNLVTDDPADTWREMMVTAESAGRLKAEAGIKPGGKKNEQPVYVFSIEWHPDDRPTRQHMLMTAVDVLRFMKMEEHQAVIVEHTDTRHPHVHITVNMIHPETERSASLYNDEYRLDRWCDRYEQTYGPIRSPERRMKFAALDQGLEPPPKIRQPKHHNNPAVKAVIANDNATARDRAKGIQEDYKAYAARLKATQEENWKRRKAEQRQLWNDYRTARQALRARHQFAIDKIYKHKRDRHALPLSIQGFRDWKESHEWKKLMERLKAEKRRFDYRERTLFGFISNAIALIRPGMQRKRPGPAPGALQFARLRQGAAGIAARETGPHPQSPLRKAVRQPQSAGRAHPPDPRRAAGGALPRLRHPEAGARSAPRAGGRRAENRMAGALDRAQAAVAAMGGGIWGTAPAAAGPGPGLRRQKPSLPCPAPHTRPIS